MGGTCAQLANMNATTASAQRARGSAGPVVFRAATSSMMSIGTIAGDASMFESGLWIIILEAAVALVIGVLIVWWTVPRDKPRDDDPR